MKHIRWREWDYASNGACFVTISTKNQDPYLGKIENDKFIYSTIGMIAEKFWKEIPEHFPFAKPDTFQLMPDHLHGIIVIEKRVEELPKRLQYQVNQFGPQEKKPASIIRAFKGAVKKHATDQRIPFHWRARYNDRVIRNFEEYLRIDKYIKDNVKNWKKGK
jgi:putative transposase